jgi:hypothetical protein
LCSVGWRTMSWPEGLRRDRAPDGANGTVPDDRLGAARRHPRRTAAAAPEASSRPPRSPAPGPRTTSRSARRTSSGS